MMPYVRFRAWQAADELAFRVYGATQKWPRTEQYGLTSQARRSAVSVPLNLVEGSSKLGPREFARFADIAIGSLAELAYLLRFARRLGYIEEVELDALEELRSRTAQLTWKLVRSLRAAANV